jgi:hypothetical protein
MKFSAEKASRKWPCGGFGCGQWRLATAAAVLLTFCVQIEPAAARRSGAWSQGPWNDLFQDARPKRRRAISAMVPLPKPRPAEAPGLPDDAKPAVADKPTEAEKPAAEQAAPTPPQPSACRLALTEAIAIAPSIPAISGPGGCGGDDLVRLEAVVLADNKRVAVKPAAILRCGMAAAVADWVRSDIAPFAQSLGTSVSDLDNFDSFECRGRNRVAGAKLSEHGRANALDVRALKFANGQSLSLTDRTVAREQREAVLYSVCARFSTVLGPGSDWYHEDHIHLDLAERHGGYHICQWNVYDPMPAIAPLLPAGRPDDAPPREVAAKPDAAKPAAAEPEAVVPEPKPRPTKKRRRTGAF